MVTRPHHWQAVADEMGRAFEGSATGEVEALQTDDVDAPVSWKGKGRDLRELKGPWWHCGSPSDRRTGSTTTRWCRPPTGPPKQAYMKKGPEGISRAL